MRMLGRMARRLRQTFDNYDWDRSVRHRKFHEERQWRREIPEETRPFPDDNDLDPTGDCHHGCNGDCEVSGSDRCNFTCHDPTVGEFWRDLHIRLEDPEFRRGYIQESLRIQGLMNESTTHEDPDSR